VGLTIPKCLRRSCRKHVRTRKRRLQSNQGKLKGRNGDCEGGAEQDRSREPPRRDSAPRATAIRTRLSQTPSLSGRSLASGVGRMGVFSTRCCLIRKNGASPKERITIVVGPPKKIGRANGRLAGQSDDSGELRRDACSRRAFPATGGALGLIGIPPWIQPTT